MFWTKKFLLTVIAFSLRTFSMASHIRKVRPACFMSTTSAGPMSRPKFWTVAVEGNIASGKTEFLKVFENYKGVKVFPEPVDKWRNVGGHNTLDLMYSDPARWSLTFQTYVQLTMLHTHTRNDNFRPGDVKIMERSIYSAKYCFVENLFRSKNMSEVEYAVLTEWFNWIIKNTYCRVDLIIYLQTKPETVYERLIKRSRPEERRIPLDYLKSLHDLYENWLIDEKIPVPAKVISVDADGDWESMRAEYEKLAKEILNWQTKSSSETEDSFETDENLVGATRKRGLLYRFF